MAQSICGLRRVAPGTPSSADKPDSAAPLPTLLEAPSVLGDSSSNSADLADRDDFPGDLERWSAPSYLAPERRSLLGNLRREQALEEGDEGRGQNSKNEDSGWAWWKCNSAPRRSELSESHRLKEDFHVHESSPFVGGSGEPIG